MFMNMRPSFYTWSRWQSGSL